ncbi:MAG: serine hydrolase domain-containing protein [Legionellales bacterium]
MPLSWLQQEQLEKPLILKKFWEERVLHPKDTEQRAHSINGIKNHFLLALPKPGMNDTEWADYVDQAWADGSAFASEEAFYKFFEHISSVKAVGVAEGLIPRVDPSKKAITVTEDETESIKQYTKDKGITVSGIVGSITTGIHPCCSDSYSTSDVFTTQSISKVFTGVLALRLLEEGVISTKDLDNPPIQVASSTTAALVEHPQILERLGEATLHQALTHYAGLGVGEGAPFGDYYGNYIHAVEVARERALPTPEIRSIEEFIPFIPNKTAAAGTVGADNWHYSNSGIILAALSLEHLYNERRDKTLESEPLSFDEIMKKYVTGPTAANMSCFQASPQGLTVRQDASNPIAAHMVGSPGGGYFSTAEDLGKFAHWMHNKCQDSAFVELIGQYGQEFCPHPQSKTIEHTGDGPSSSGFFSLNWETGNLVVILNDQRAIAASEVGREIQDHIFSQKPVLTITDHPASIEASERMQSFKARIPHAAHTPAADSAEDETQEDDNSITP